MQIIVVIAQSLLSSLQNIITYIYIFVCMCECVSLRVFYIKVKTDIISIIEVFFWHSLKNTD